MPCEWGIEKKEIGLICLRGNKPALCELQPQFAVRVSVGVHIFCLLCACIFADT